MSRDERDDAAVRAALSRRPWSNARPRGGYASTAEYHLALRLDLLLRAGAVDAWEYVAAYPQARYRLVVNGVLVCTYLPDFRVCWTPAGQSRQQAVVEVKGRRAREWPLKKRLFRALYPGEPLHVVPSGEVDTYHPEQWEGE